MRKTLFTLIMFAALSLTLTGCGGKAGSAVSDAASKTGSAISSTISRVESGMDNSSSRNESSSSRYESSGYSSGMMDPNSTVDSGDDGFIGEESGVSSFMESSGSVSSR